MHTWKATLLGLGLGLFALTAHAAVDARLDSDVPLKAGPDMDYPTVAWLDEGDAVDIEGCLSARDWCEIETRWSERGWVPSYALTRLYRNAYWRYNDNVFWSTLPILAFEGVGYWDRNYRHHPWYRSDRTWFDRTYPYWRQPRHYRHDAWERDRHWPNRDRWDRDRRDHGRDRDHDRGDRDRRNDGRWNDDRRNHDGRRDQDNRGSTGRGYDRGNQGSDRNWDGGGGNRGNEGRGQDRGDSRGQEGQRDGRGQQPGRETGIRQPVTTMPVTTTPDRTTWQPPRQSTPTPARAEAERWQRPTQQPREPASTRFDAERGQRALPQPARNAASPMAPRQEQGRAWEQPRTAAPSSQVGRGPGVRESSGSDVRRVGREGSQRQREGREDQQR